jgi:hypothetical protein
VLSLLAGPLRLASIVICLVVIASFALFVVNQAGEASTKQVAALGGPSDSGKGATKKTGSGEATLRTRIDEVANDLTSPFSGVTAGSSSEWTIHGINLLLTLLIYGFGFGFLARIIRMR